MHLRTYQRVAQYVHDASILALNVCYSKAVQAVRSFYCSMDSNLDPDSTIPIIVSYDGTWHKRGHSSHYGVGVVIELYTGLVIDTHVVSNYCAKCVKRPDPNDPKYEQWCTTHAPACSTNFDGSAVAMEVEASKVLFGRSVIRHNLRYQICLCDGDAKTIHTLNSMKIYPEDIKKEDCINHIAKRMKNGIMNLRKSLMGTKDSISGKRKGQVTEKIATKLTNYYADALKTNAPDIKSMQNAVFASLYHMSSTNEEPNHKLCPPGEKSWCKYQRETFMKVEDSKRTNHNAELTVRCVKLLEPLYTRLTNADLLQRCSRMRTQNANECYNGQVWRRCPKSLSTSKSIVDTAVAMASLDFNYGPTGYSKILEELDISSGVYRRHHILQSTRKRTSDAARHCTNRYKKLRKLKKLQRAGLSDKRKEKEGVMYNPGGFNL